MRARISNVSLKAVLALVQYVSNLNFLHYVGTLMYCILNFILQVQKPYSLGHFNEIVVMKVKKKMRSGDK